MNEVRFLARLDPGANKAVITREVGPDEYQCATWENPPVVNLPRIQVWFDPVRFLGGEIVGFRVRATGVTLKPTGDGLLHLALPPEPQQVLRGKLYHETEDGTRFCSRETSDPFRPFELYRDCNGHWIYFKSFKSEESLGAYLESCGAR